MRRSHKRYDENNNVYFIGKGPIRDTLSGLNYEMAKHIHDTNAEALKKNKLSASKPGYRGSITSQELMRAEYDLQEQAKAMNRAKKQMIAARAGVGIGVPVVGALAYRHYKKKQEKNAFDMLEEMYIEKVGAYSSPVMNQFRSQATNLGKNIGNVLDAMAPGFKDNLSKSLNNAATKSTVAQPTKLPQLSVGNTLMSNSATAIGNSLNQNNGIRRGFTPPIMNKANIGTQFSGMPVTASNMLEEMHLEKTAGIKNIGKRYIEMLTGSAKRAAKTNMDTAIREFDNTKIKRDNLAIWRRQVNAQRDELNKQFNHYNTLRDNMFKKQDSTSKSINHYQDLVNNMYSERNKLEKNIDDQYAMKTKAQKDLAENKELPQLIKDNILAIHDKDIAKAKKDLEIFNSKTKNINSERQRVLDDLKSSRTQAINDINVKINNIKAQQKDKANLVNNNINPRIQALSKKEEDFRKSIPKLRKQYGKERANQILTVTGTVGVGGLGAHKVKKAIQNRVENKRR